MRTEASRGDIFAVLFDDVNFILTLMKGTDIHYPKNFHIGFPQANEEQVNQINQHLKEDGFDVQPPKPLLGYTFYVQSPGGFTVEVFC